LAIITYFHRPKQARSRKAQAADMLAIVKSVSRKPRPIKPAAKAADPEVAAQTDAFFARMVRPPED
jgi:hypothetical protein